MSNEAFREMAAAMRSRNGFDARMISFRKGAWSSGKDGAGMDGAELIAVVSHLMIGWTKWVDRRSRNGSDAGGGPLGLLEILTKRPYWNFSSIAFLPGPGFPGAFLLREFMRGRFPASRSAGIGRIEQITHRASGPKAGLQAAC